MRPHWQDENGAYCEEHAPDVEGDLNSNECDTPQNCQVCGKPCEYSLTEAGIEYVLDHIREELEAGEAARNKIRDEPGRYYDGSRQVEVVRDWAVDLSQYGGLSKSDSWLIKYFLDVTAESAVDTAS